MSEGKKQRAREKKNQKRQLRRVAALEKRKTSKEIAEYQHWIKFHTDDNEVSPDHAFTPEQLEDIDRERKKEYNIHSGPPKDYDPRTTPLDVGTTRMKLDWDDEEKEAVPAFTQDPTLTYEEQLRKELGLG